MSNKNFICTVLFLLCAISLVAQNKESKWTAGISLASAKYTVTQSKVVGGEFVFQTPRFNISRYFAKGFKLDAGFATALGDSQKYTTFDGTLRYDFNRSDENTVPYIMLGGSFISAKAFTPTLNFGVGNTFWFSQKYGINIQAMYRLSQDKFSSQTSHLYTSVGVVYSFISRSLVPRLWQQKH